MGDGEDTNREGQLRRAARRQGLVLRKSRRRDPRAIDFGVYYLIDPTINGLMSTCPSLEDVERELCDMARRSESARS
jgi:hypothetical protein